MKKSLVVFLMLLISKSFALTLDDLTDIKPLDGRLSNTDKVESKKIDISKKTQDTVLSSTKDTELNEKDKENKPDLTYADLSLKRIADDVSFELEESEQKINSDLAILWSAAMERSETMKYTIYKLSNPEEDKPNESTMKKILKPLANFSSIAGASVAGDPVIATSALIGGGLVNAFMKDDKEVNYRFSKVSDADMVLLVRKIDELQKKLLNLYVDYKTKEKLYNMAQENLLKKEELYKKSQNKSKEELLITDVYYRKAKSNVQKAKDEFDTSRAILENLVGTNAVLEIEKN